MLQSISIVFVGVLAYFIDGSVLKKDKMTREWWIFILLLSLGVLLGCLQSFHVLTLSPLKVVDFVFGPLSRVLSRWLT